MTPDTYIDGFPMDVLVDRAALRVAELIAREQCDLNCIRFPDLKCERDHEPDEEAIQDAVLYPILKLRRDIVELEDEREDAFNYALISHKHQELARREAAIFGTLNQIHLKAIHTITNVTDTRLMDWQKTLGLGASDDLLNECG